MDNQLQVVKLKELVVPARRSETVEPDKIYRQIGVRLWGEGAYERESIEGSQTKYKTLFRAEEGDIIVNKIWARNGSVAVVQSSLAGCYGSNEFPMFSPIPSKLDPRWVHWITKTPDFWNQCDQMSQGTSGKNRIRPEKFLEVEIPLPPLEEQRRIVARIEELSTAIGEARGLRNQSIEEREVLRYSSLKQIRELSKKTPYHEFKLGSLTTVTSGGTPSRNSLEYWDGNIPWIKTGELLDDDISAAEEYITQAGVENSSAKVFPPQTILIALYGQGQTRGRTGRLLIHATTNQACCAILPKPELFESRFIQFWLRSLYLELREDAKGGAQPNWNGAMIKNINIILPPLSEQHNIVAYLDDLQAKIDSLKRLQAETAAELDALLPSILDKAFKGEL